MASAGIVGYCALAFVIYEAIGLGAYEAAAAFGRCLHILNAATRGYF